MNILYYSGYGDWWGAYPKDVLDVDRGRTVGGGEAGMLESAFGLAARGHRVTICSCAEPGVYRGVIFRPEREFYGLLTREPFEALVAWSDPNPLSLVGPEVARLLVQQLNDLIYWRGWETTVDCLVSPSQHHLDFMYQLGWAGRGAVMHNGCRPDDWWRYIEVLTAAGHPSKRPLQVGYWSSPDRGLHHLLRCWPRIREAVPGAQLKVAYQIDRLLVQTEGHQDWVQAFTRINLIREYVLAAKRDPSIEFLGPISRTKLREYEKTTRVMCYPSDGIMYTEGFGVNVINACAAGCLPVVRPADALPSIYGDVPRWLTTPVGDSGFDDELVEKVVKGLTEWSLKPERPTLETLRAKAEEFTWERAVGEMERAINDTLEAK